MIHILSHYNVIFRDLPLQTPALEGKKSVVKEDAATTEMREVPMKRLSYTVLPPISKLFVVYGCGQQLPMGRHFDYKLTSSLYQHSTSKLPRYHQCPTLLSGSIF